MMTPAPLLCFMHVIDCTCHVFPLIAFISTNFYKPEPLLVKIYTPSHAHPQQATTTHNTLYICICPSPLL